MRIWSTYFMVIILALAGCQRKKGQRIDYETLAARTENGVNAVIEIPAGTNHKIEYDKEKGIFINDQKDGKDRVIEFLPYPGNYGFIPSTYMAPEKGGDGDALDILVLGESLPTGTVIEVTPIGALLLLDEGEVDTKIIAIPSDTSLQVIPIKGYRDFSIQYDGAKHIVESWFLYYDGLGTNQFNGWRDESYAMELIERWIR